jgi:hypothetical protein
VAEAASGGGPDAQVTSSLAATRALERGGLAQAPLDCSSRHCEPSELPKEVEVNFQTIFSIKLEINSSQT